LGVPAYCNPGATIPRIPLIDESIAGEDVREALAAMPPQGTVWRMVAHAETAFRPFLQLAGRIQTSLALDPRLRQLAILRVADLTECEYERVQHEVIAELEGVPAEQTAALAEGRADGPEFDEREALVLRFVSESVQSLGASEATMAALAERFPPREIVELMLVISQYLGLAVLLRSTALEPVPPLSADAIRQARAKRAALS
jgi:4-carboxymuconolactone decarboxylase